MQIADIFRAQIVDVGAKSVVLEVTGGSTKIDALVSLLRQYGVKELVRTGKISMLRRPRNTVPTATPIRRAGGSARGLRRRIKPDRGLADRVRGNAG
jgi:hypothetical protein